MKKLFSIIMCVLMVMCFMPTMTFAATVENCTAADCSHVAAIGTTHYDTLQEAITAATDTATEITLLKDTTEDITIAASKNITLNLGGHKITNSASDTITVALGATLTITGTGTVDNVTHARAAIYNNGTTVLSGGTYDRSLENGSDKETSGGNSYYTILNHGTMTINAGVTVQTAGKDSSKGRFSSLVDNGYYDYSSTAPRTGYVSGTNQENPSLTINGGSFYGGLNTIKNDDNGNAVINDGTFSNFYQAVLQNHNTAEVKGGTYTAAADSNSTTYGIYNCGCHATYDKGTLTISDGTFTANYALADVSTKTPTINISGGTFNGSTAAIAKSTNSNANISLTGGTFSSNPTAYVANNYAAVGNTDGTWTVKSTTSTEEGTGITVKTDDDKTTVVETKTEGSTTTTTTSVTNNDGSTSTTVKTTGTPDSTGTTTSTETKLEVKTVEGTTVETKTEATTVKTSTNVETTEKTITTTTGSGDPVVTTEKVVKDPVNNTEVDTKVTGTKAETTANVSTPTSNKETITVDATAAKESADTVDSVKVTLPSETVTALNNAAKGADKSKTIETVELKTDVATLEIDNKALKTLTEDAGENALVLTVAKTDSTVTTPGSTTEQTTTVTATYELTAKVGTQDAFTSNSSATNGNITINVNYAPNDSSKAIKVYYVNGKTKTDMGATYYNNKLTWKTNHFSTFQVEETEAVKYGGSSSSKSSSTVDKTEDTTKDTGDTSGSSTVEEKDTKAEVTKLVNALSFKARSSKTKKGSIKVNLTVSNDDIKEITDLGYTVKYKFYRSTKKSSAYTATLEKNTKTYVNTTGVSGTRYYYKARVMVYDSEGTLVAKTALKQCKYASRIK